jgi:allantoicase
LLLAAREGVRGAATSDFTELTDLAAKRFGGMVVAANDEFFAPKESLLEPAAPVWDEHRYTDRGKWMDGWETRRRRTPGHDWAIVRLGLAGVVRGLLVDTSFFRGNYPEACSLEAAVLGAGEDATDPAVAWVEVLPRSMLSGDSHNRLVVDSPYRFTHLRLNIYPDGGVARLRVHGEVVPDPAAVLGGPGQQIDLAAVEHGGQVVTASDMFFSAPANLISGGRAANMGDGWETKRRRGPGHDWVILRLAASGTVRRVEVDTSHFKGNYPDTCSLEVCDAPDASADELTGDKPDWREVLPRTRLQPHLRHLLDVAGGGEATHVRFNIHPDGGVSRLRVLGTLGERGWADLRQRWLDSEPGRT